MVPLSLSRKISGSQDSVFLEIQTYIHTVQICRTLWQDTNLWYGKTWKVRWIFTDDGDLLYCEHIRSSVGDRSSRCLALTLSSTLGPDWVRSVTIGIPRKLPGSGRLTTTSRDLDSTELRAFTHFDINHVFAFLRYVHHTLQRTNRCYVHSNVTCN